MNSNREDIPTDLRDLSNSEWADSAAPTNGESAIARDALDLTFQPFPIGCLPRPLAALVREGAKAIQCDPAFLALPLLAVLGAAIGNTRRLRVSNTWHAPSIVWALIVSPSGTGKSPAYRVVLKPFRDKQRSAFKQHEKTLADFEREHLLYEAKLAAWRNDQRKTTPGDAYTVAPPDRPVRPTATRYIVSDTTAEAIAPLLRDNPRGLLLARDELSGWLASFDRYAKSGQVSADAPHWLSMHDGDDLTIDRKTSTPPTIHIPSASVCIAGCIQPGILEKSMSAQHRESGLMARILFAMPPRTRRQWTEADVDPDTERAVADVFDRLLTLEGDSVLDPDHPDTPDFRPVLIEMTPDAKRAWIDFYNRHNEQADDLSDDESAAWSKLEGYVPRFALVVHLARWASGDPAVPTPDTPVDAASMACAIDLVHWFANETLRVYAMLGESEGDRELIKLEKWIADRGGSTTVRELQRGPVKYRGAGEAKQALDRLVSHGRATEAWIPPGVEGGPPTKLVRLCPRPRSAATATQPSIPPQSGG